MRTIENAGLVCMVGWKGRAWIKLKLATVHCSAAPYHGESNGSVKVLHLGRGRLSVKIPKWKWSRRGSIPAAKHDAQKRFQAANGRSSLAKLQLINLSECITNLLNLAHQGFLSQIVLPSVQYSNKWFNSICHQHLCSAACPYGKVVHFHHRHLEDPNPGVGLCLGGGTNPE